jgi:diguanylate cyclase (GGDEF)-like protein
LFDILINIYNVGVTVQNLSLGNLRFKKNMVSFNIFLIILVTVVFILLSAFQKQITKIVTSKNAIYIENDKLSNEIRDFNYYFKDYGDGLKDTFTVKILKSDIDKIGESSLTLFTPLIQSEAFEIYINDVKIAIEGDTKDLNSSIWTKSHCYNINADIFNQEENILKVVQYSRYMGGGICIPFIIDGYQASAKLRNIYMLDAHQSILGVAVALIIFLILLIILLPKHRKLYILMIITLVFLGFGYIEYYKICKLQLEYLLFKKIILTISMMSIISGTILFKMVFYVKNKNKKLILAYCIVLLLCAIFPQDMITYKKVYSIQSIAIIPIFIYWGYLSLKNCKKSYEGKIFLTFTISLTIYIIAFNISELTQYTHLTSCVIVVLPLFIILIATIILSDIYHVNINEALTSIQYKKAYEKSIIDQNTGLYNASYMKQIINVNVEPFIMVILDIDDFKGINDRYGHVAGDEALKNVANTVKSMLRDDDYMGRYGGDEFIIILNTDDTLIASKILERIRKTIENKEFCFDNVYFKFTISIGYCLSKGNVSFDKILHKADKALYRAKNNGKNKLYCYDNKSDAI